ncbi:MAG: MFS transporter [Pseudomonadota bacterium]
MTLPPITTFLTARLVWGVAFYMMVTVAMIYQVEVAGLTPLELVLVGTAMEVSAFVFEVPTGVVADRYSRKFSVIIGYAIFGVSLVLLGLFPTFWMIVVSSALSGLGWTFVSGAHEAWLADEIGVEAAGPVYLQGQKYSNGGSFLGIAVAVVLGSMALHWPLLLAGILFLAWGCAALVLMPETRFAPARTADRGEPGTLWRSLDVVRASPILVMLMIVGVVFGMFSEGYDRLSTAHLLRTFEFPALFGAEPVVLFGVFLVIGNLLGMALLHRLASRVETNSDQQLARALLLLTGLVGMAVLVFALSVSVWLAILMYLVLIPLRQAIDPLTVAWINRYVGSDIRATVISLNGQADALGQMSGPVVGGIAQLAGLRVALTCSALLLLPVVALYVRTSRNLGARTSGGNAP